MRRLTLAILTALMLSPFGVAQRTNTFYASQLPGSTVAAKVTAAQAMCNPSTSIPCYIVIDPDLASWTQGTLPAKCTQCVWEDYRLASANPFGGTLGSLSTSNLTDWTNVGAGNGMSPVYNSISHKWIPGYPSGSTGNMSDWNNYGRENGNVPVWNSTTNKWTPGTVTSGGGSSQTSLYSGFVPPSLYLPVLLVQTNTTAQGATPVNASNISLVNPVTVGNTLIVSLTGDNPCTSCTLSDNLGNIFTLAASQSVPYSNFDMVWVAPITHGGVSTITVAGSGFAFPNMIASEFQGLNPTIDSSVNFSNSDGQESFTISTTNLGEMVYFSLSQKNVLCGNTQVTPAVFMGLNVPVNIVQSPSNTGGSIFAAFTQLSGDGISVAGALSSCGGYIQGVALSFLPQLGSFGVDGAYYMDLANSTLYGPRSGGVWPSTGFTLANPTIESGTLSCDGSCSVTFPTTYTYLSTPAVFCTMTGASCNLTSASTTGATFAVASSGTINWMASGK